MVDDFSDLMMHVVGVESAIGYDAQSKPTYGAPVSRKAHVEEQVEQLNRSDGTNRIVVASVYMATTADVPIDSRVTLPSGTVGYVLFVERLYDEGGLHHIMLMLGN